jgi:hypothetical protein
MYFKSLWAEDNCRIFAVVIYISEVFSSLHGPGSRNPDWKVFVIFLNSSSQIPGYCIKAGYECFLPDYFQLIIY